MKKIWYSFGRETREANIHIDINAGKHDDDQMNDDNNHQRKRRPFSSKL